LANWLGQVRFLIHSRQTGWQTSMVGELA